MSGVFILDSRPKSWPYSHLGTQWDFLVWFSFFWKNQFFFSEGVSDMPMTGWEHPRVSVELQRTMGSLGNTGNELEVVLSASSALNFTKSELWKRLHHCGTSDSRNGLGIVWGPQDWFLLRNTTFPAERNSRGDSVEAKTSFGRPSINKALQNLWK